MATVTEEKIDGALRARGWAILGRGWPDRLCWRNVNGHMEIMCVEIKSEGDTVNEAQLLNHSILVAFGLPVYVVREEKDMDHITNYASSLPRYAEEIISRIETRCQELEERAARIEGGYVQRRERILNVAHGEAEACMDAMDEKMEELKQAVRSRLEQLREIASALRPDPEKLP